MVNRNALAAALFALILAGVQAGAQTPAAAGQAPPLLGAFGDNFTLFDPPVPAPPEAFAALDGAPVRLADFKGRVVVLNFWATWCAPCVREMPSLDRLQAALEDRGLAVLAVSIDRGGAKVIRPFAKRLGLERLGLYHDPKGALFKAFGVTGLPTTFLIDRRGQIVGAYPGAAEWDEPEARALIEHYLNRPAGAAAVKTAG
ncbi:MAG: TlpA family protein disulfide reductase [Proteobacteria bacterium]|nr:TlpA family protein disulfide reductase [Pseudomonadota bacterium]